MSVLSVGHRTCNL